MSRNWAVAMRSGIVRWIMVATLVLVGSVSGRPLLAEDKNDLEANCASRRNGNFIVRVGVLGLTTREGGNSDVTVSYQSHYNEKFTACLLFVKTDGAGRQNAGSKFRRLLNVQDFWIYANYFDKPREDKQEGGSIPLMCRLAPSRTEELPCKSEEDFKEFVARYMEE